MSRSPNDARPPRSATGDGGTAPRPRGARCPTCRAATTWDGNPNRPFCSLSCRLIDLGHWLDERYRVEADDDRVDDDDAPAPPRAPDPPSRTHRVPRVP